MNEIIPQAPQPQSDTRRTYMLVIYALYALSVVTAFSAIVGVIVAYVKRGDMLEEPYAGHIAYLIKTFWVSLAGSIVGALTMMFGIGLVVLLVVSIWFVYRVVAGFIKFYDGKTVSADGWL